MSGLDGFLRYIQQGAADIYGLFGDGIYNQNGLMCIRSYYRSYGPLNMLTPWKQRVNQKMRPIRETIEWSYGDVGNILRLSPCPDNYKLGKRHPYAQAQLRTCFLIYNCYVCLNGNKSSSYNMFDCRPPSLENYLDLNLHSF